MTIKVLCLDAETNDPTLKQFSSGAVLKYHYPTVDFSVLGIGLISHENEERYFNLMNNNPQDLENLLAIIDDHQILVGHNILYDLACLKYLYRERLDLKNFIKIDTMLLAKMIDQHLKEKIKFSHSPYSLDTLCKWYKIDEHKESEMLHDWCWVSGTYQEWYKKTTGRNCHTRPSKNILGKYCITHLKDFPEQIVANYCLQDNRATKSLYNKLMPMLDEKHDLQMISDVLDVCLAAKFSGIRIDLKAAKKLSEEWLKIAEEAVGKFLDSIEPYLIKIPKIEKSIKENSEFYNKVISVTRDISDFNINSAAQLGPVLELMGHKIPRTDKGNYSIDKDWLAEQKDPILKNLALYRKAKKNEKDFIQKLIKYQECIPKEYRNEDIGWLYPSMKPLGAVATGRFTSGGGQGSYELNMLAVSAHDKVFGEPVRKLFLPHEGEKIICFDYSNQEPRIMTHYAKILGCSGIDPVIEEWNANPFMKYHKKVQEMTDLEYSVAKTVTLGLMYDLRSKGLSKQLGITQQQAEELINKYFKLIPFVQEIQNITSANLKKLGYIRSLAGRKLYIDPSYEYKGRVRSQERKALSKLIQGSAADMTMKALVSCHKAGLKILLAIHDEVLITSKDPEKDFASMKQCMEAAYKLVIPVVAEGGIGDNWGESKP